MNKLLSFVLVIVLFAASVQALGITPGKTTLDYSPGKEVTGTFTVVNDEAKDMNVVILVQGALNASIGLSEVSLAIGAAEHDKPVNYKIVMPAGLSPGLHSTEVIAMQLPGKSGTGQAFVGATVAVATRIDVFAPYPGKYAEADLNVIGPDADGKIIFVLPTTSRGDQNLARVRAVIDIYGSLNEKIATVSSNELAIPSGDRQELVASWHANVSSGTYRAVATLIYDEQTRQIEKQFNVGTALLELQQIEVNDFSLGDIAKFEMLVENKWSQPISGAFAQMYVYNDQGQPIADFKSQTYDVPALSKAMMVAFWDTAGIKQGTYDSSVFLRFGQQSSQQDLELEVSENSINVVGLGYVIARDRSAGSSGGSTNITTLLIIGIVVLVLINVLWFLVLRKKMKGK